ncbi:ovochymase-1-like [Uranotaenia lowii]|uniref:ovochymase-1-like n=1 Tax=Uranotaenia lowii TaxID=190385 RepID=UPI0024796EEC|nr:ovochymase-1-like [Uranotaenia lowii]
MQSVILLLSAALLLQNVQSGEISVSNGSEPICLVIRDPTGQSTFYKFPWNVALYFKQSDELQSNSVVKKCGGTLIDEQRVITSANCVVNSNGESINASEIEVRLGDHNEAENFSTEQTQAVQQIIIHPKFDGNRHNIAFLVLNESVKINNFVNPICFGSTSKDIHVGDQGLILGWSIKEYGAFPRKRVMSHVMVVNNSECADSGAISIESLDSNEVFCARNLNVFDTCFKNTGDGVYFASNGQYHLEGIATLPKGGETERCETSEYLVFTNYIESFARSVFAVLDGNNADTKSNRDRRAITGPLPIPPPMPEHKLQD